MKINEILRKYIWLVTVPVILSLSFAQLQVSSLNRSNIFRLKPGMAAVNLAILLFIFTMLHIVVRNELIALVGVSIFLTVWSIANHFVVKFHGSPLFPSEIASITTAAEVAGDYKLRMDLAAAIVIFLFLIQMTILLLINVRTKHLQVYRLKVWHKLIVLALCGLVIFSVRDEILANRYPWSWKQGIAYDGFSVSAIRDAKRQQTRIIKPEAYQPELLKEESVSKDTPAEFPDIILILNESFCDLDFYTKVDADQKYLKEFYSIDGAFYGHAVCSSTGGGTNNSEFELLTSKSMYLLGGSAPFNYLESEQIGRSVVGYLKDFGYNSMAMHTSEYNYRRNYAYPALGFDQIYLGKSFYKYYNCNGDRRWLDQDNYRDMIDYYNESDASPRLVFLLTYQNHGGYEQNDSAADTVHTGNDYGAVTDDVNEYLSSVKLSADAFVWLTDYFSESDRPVIICMVGDHAPPFISELPADNESGLKDSIARKVIPYVMWSNYGVPFSACSEYATMVDLVPMLLKSAGIPLSSFYQTVFNLNRQYPIRTTDDFCVDAKGNTGKYDDNKEEYRNVTDYYCLEYNSMLLSEEYREELFRKPE